jgi:hypothetical protein
VNPQARCLQKSEVALDTHPYLRSFLAGILVPTLVLPLLLCAFVVLRLGLQVPFPIERALIFPMALVPALWGLWNMLWEWSHASTHLPLGLHGAVLPLLMMPVGTLIATHLGVLQLGAAHAIWFGDLHISYALIAICFAAALAGYYLLWKYVVGFVNQVLGIA